MRTLALAAAAACLAAAPAPTPAAARTQLAAPLTYPGLRGPVAPYLGEKFRTVPEVLDPTLLLRRDHFGYTPAEVEKFFAAPPPAIVDDTGLDSAFLAPPPPPGVHPRVLMHADQLPALRRRLAETEAGRVLAKTIREHLGKTLTGPAARFAADYAALVAGTVPAQLDANLAYALTYEAFRCLLDEDQPAGIRVAAAITTFAQVAARDLAAARAKARPGAIDLTETTGPRPLFDARTVAQEATREFSLGLAYDFAYPFMSEPQRDAVRAVLVAATRDMTLPGAESLPALHAGSSYWVSWSSRVLLALTAIEGEPGYDAASFDRAAAAYRRFVLSLYASGEAFEAFGKNFLSLEHLVLLARRDPARHLLGYTHLRAVFNDYLVATTLPWGGGFTFWDSNAKTGSLLNRTADAAVYHALFPRDRAGEWVYRQQLNHSLTQLSRTLNTRHFLSATDALVCAIFATDFTDPSAAANYTAVTHGRPPTFFCPDTNNLLTRSAWSPDALYLGYLNRAIPGGHALSDRSHFHLYSHGRVWSTYAYARDVKEQFGPAMRSILLADGSGPSAAEAQCVAFQDRPFATLIASDLSNPWNFQTASAEPAPAGAVLGPKTRSYNSFRLTPSSLPWMDLPIGELPDWYSSRKPGTAPAAGATARRDWYQRRSVRYAFRTAALVRGPRPYALIVDDLRLDDAPHRYVWGMTLPPDVALLSADRIASTPTTSSSAAILLTERGPLAPPSTPSATPRRLLAHVLAAPALAETPATVETVPVKNGTQPDIALNRLHIPSQSVAGEFKVLLFPHLEGDPLPAIRWDAVRTTVTVAWPDQTDEITFAPASDGRTRLALTRTGPDATAATPLGRLD